MSLRLRVLSFFLAALPLLWGFCPCCLGASSCGADAAASTAPAKRTCPCCSHGDDVPGAPKAPPKDCGNCAATQARAGASPAAPGVVLPAVDVVGIVVAVGVETPSEVAVPAVRSGGPAPPDPTLAAIATVVLLI